MASALTIVETAPGWLGRLAAGLAAGLLASAAAALAARRLFHLLPFALIGGVAVAAQWPIESWPAALWAGGALLGGILAAARRSLPAFRVASLIFAFWFGLCLLPIHAAIWGTPMLARPAYGTYGVKIDEILAATPTEVRVIVSGIAPHGGARDVPMRRARLIIGSPPQLAPGDVIVAAMRFAPVPGPALPGGFDPQFHAFFDGIGAYGQTTGPPRVVTRGDPQTLPYLIDATRRAIAVRIDAALAQPAAGILRAIVTGDQSTVDVAARDAMAAAGIAHVLSVSGLHLSIVAGGVYFVLRVAIAALPAVALRLSGKRLAAGVGGIAALGYFAISGGNVAALRSTLMILLVFGAVLFGRRALTMRNVAIAALIVVVSDPASVFRPSFQLSFAAVAALVGAYENMRAPPEAPSPLARALGVVIGVGVTSLIAGAATLPFSIYHFQQTSPLGVVGNLLSFPLTSFVLMPMALFGVLAIPLGIEDMFLAAAGWSIEVMLAISERVAALSEAWRVSPLLMPSALAFVTAGFAWFAFFADRWRLLAPVLAVPFVALFARDMPPDAMIADTTKAVVVRGVAGLERASGAAHSFALDIWRETYADPIAGAAEIGCDTIACIGKSARGFRYAIVTDPAGFAEECGAVDLVVARIAVPAYCRVKLIVGPGDLAAHGVHWLRWRPGEQDFEIRRSIDRLDRPWRIP